jgi:hypothetical protein
VPTLRELRRGAAPELDFFDIVETSSGSSTGDTLMIGEYADAELPPRTFGRTFALVCDGAHAGEQRRLADSGYNNTSGRLVVSRPYSGPVEQHVEVEILGLVPAIRQLGEPGWREHANACLRDLWVSRYLTVDVPAPHVVSHNLTLAHPWLTDRRQVTDLLDQPASTSEVTLPGTNLRGVRNDGGTVWLDLWSPYAAGSQFQIPARAPGHTWVRHAGVWGASSVGLVEDDDETAAPYDLVRVMMVERALRHLMLQAPATEAATWRTQHQMYAAAAATVKQRYLQHGPTVMRLTPAGGTSTWPKDLY